MNKKKRKTTSHLPPPHRRNSFAVCTYFKEGIHALKKQRERTQAQNNTKQHPQILKLFLKNKIFI